MGRTPRACTRRTAGGTGCGCGNDSPGASLTDLTFNDPCVVFALNRESEAFVREFQPNQRFLGSPCRARFCGPAWLSVLTLETGVGPDRTAQAVSWLLSRPELERVAYRPRIVLSAGFSGALQDGLQVGDLVLATEVVDGDGNRWPTTWPGELPAGEWRPPLHRGRLLSVPRLVCSPAEKRDLGKRFDAAAVDMETATVARLCSKHGIPFGCLRAVSDSPGTALSPRLVSLLAGGRVSPLRVLAALARSPGLVPELWRLARDTRRAADQL